MEQDNYIKQLLVNSAEGASVNFTDAVLKKIRDRSATRLYVQPLVPSKWQRLFLYAFGVIVLAIFVLCLLLAASDIEIVNLIMSRELPAIDYNQVLIFILCFWIVFAGNVFLEKKILYAKGGLNANSK